MNEIFPYYHPTKIALVDDDVGFLNSLSRQLSDTIIYQCYADANTAVKDINALPHPGIYESCRGTPTDQLGSLSAQLVPWDFSCIIEQALNAERFQETSVAVIDYYMPSMDGLQLCNEIKRPEVRKLLLTGVYDTSDAINALNDDIISAYLNKNDTDLGQKVNSIIDRQQRAYFHEINRRFYASGAEIPDFLQDHAFKKYFNELLAKYNICEYYLATDPSCFYMLGENKNDYYRLLIFNDADMRAQWEIAESQYAPSELVKKLALNSVIPEFWRTGGVYDPMYAENWKDFVFEPHVLLNDRQQNYYCHFQYQPPSFQELTDKVTDFETVKNQMNTCI